MDRNTNLEEFYRRFYDQFCKSIARAAGSYENAEDVVQESFCRALTHWEGFDARRGTLFQWFSSILNNALKDFQRIERNSGMNMTKEEEESIEGGETIMSDRQESSRIIKYINKKRGDTRQILYLYYLREYNPREIEQVLGLPNDSIRQAVWKFKKEMEARFGKDPSSLRRRS